MFIIIVSYKKPSFFFKCIHIEYNLDVSIFNLQSSEWVRVRVHQMEPDLMDVGSNLEEALQLQREHDQLIARLKVSINFSCARSKSKNEDWELGLVLEQNI